MVLIVNVIKVFLSKIIINNFIQNVYVEAKYILKFYSTYIHFEKLKINAYTTNSSLLNW